MRHILTCQVNVNDWETLKKLSFLFEFLFWCRNKILPQKRPNITETCILWISLKDICFNSVTDVADFNQIDSMTHQGMLE